MKREYPVGFNEVYLTYKNRSKNNGILFSLDKPYFFKLIKSNCYYCGSPPNNIKKIKGKKCTKYFIYNGIDRIDSKTGYEKTNCVSCCIVCNRMKLDYDIKDFLMHIEKIYNNCRIIDDDVKIP